MNRRFLDGGGATGADADSDGLLLLGAGATADAEGCCERFNRREGFPPGLALESPVGPVGPVGSCDMLCFTLVEKGIYATVAKLYSD